MATDHATTVWGKDLEKREAWVIHEPTLAVGPVKKFWDGVDEIYVSPINGAACPGAVLELETGHSLVAVFEHFIELDENAIRFYAAIQQGLAGLIVVSARNASASGVTQDVGIALTVAAFRTQLAAIESGAARAPQEEVMG